ncbi:unnamed protein product, partial [marine sediment metagenome]
FKVDEPLSPYPLGLLTQKSKYILRGGYSPLKNVVFIGQVSYGTEEHLNIGKESYQRSEGEACIEYTLSSVPD